MHLTETELKVSQLILKGKTNKEIGADLHMALDTVKKHVSSIYKKRKVSNRIELILTHNTQNKDGFHY